MLLNRQLNITAPHSQFIFLKSIILIRSARDRSRVGSLFRKQHLVEILLLSFFYSNELIIFHHFVDSPTHFIVRILGRR